METIELKLNLHKLIEEIENESLLNAIYVLITQKAEISEKVETKVDFWDELPEEVKNDIDEAIEEGKRGEGISHKEAMKQIKEKLELL